MTRGHCQICGNERKLTRYGTLPQHQDCEGSRHPPIEVETTLVVKALRAEMAKGPKARGSEVLSLMNRLIEAQPKPNRYELREAYASLRDVFRGLYNLAWFLQAMDTYGHCAMCGGKLNAAQTALAMSRYEKQVCGAECTAKQIVLYHGCCPQAQLIPCVCMYAFKCPEHGERHIGTHD